jgi:hypothetical protein
VFPIGIRIGIGQIADGRMSIEMDEEQRDELIEMLSSYRHIINEVLYANWTKDALENETRRIDRHISELYY